jgi:ATP-dependent RNA helicase RhlE
MAFQDFGLHPIITRNLTQIGYLEPRPIQVQSLEPILGGRDVIGLAEAGSGKTAAFIVPIAHHLISIKPPRSKGRRVDPMTRFRAIVLCPTRELARQVADEAAAIVKGSVIRVACAYGKVAITPQAQAMARGVDLLVATPGRLRELQDGGAVALAYVRHVVLDEADRMLDMGFLPQVEQILQAIPSGAGPRQTVLFTATMPAEIETLAGQFLHDPLRIEIGRHTTPVAHVRQHLVPVADQDKVPMLLHLIQQAKRRGVLVFCRTKRRVGWVGVALQRHGISAGMIHGDRTQPQRIKALDRFAAGELHVLVATDVAARGLHIPAVQHVVNYDLPLEPQEYVHRIGRAGHGRGSGEAFTFLDEDDRRRWRAILDVTGINVYAESLNGFKPTKDVRRSGRGTRPSTPNDAAIARRPPNKRRIKRGAAPGRRSKKSRPIKKGQRPGRGVIPETPKRLNV